MIDKDILLKEAADALYLYLSAGDKSARKSASTKAKDVYKKITGKDFHNPTETINELYSVIGFHHYRCCYCEAIVPRAKITSEHLIPKVYGGVNLPKNILPCCSECNNLRGHKTFGEFRAHIKVKRGNQIQIPERVMVYDNILKNIDIIEAYVMKMGDDLLKDRRLMRMSTKVPTYYYNLFNSSKK